MADLLFVLLRWLHIASVATLVGGTLYGWLTLRATRDTVSADVVTRLGDAVAARYRPWAWLAIAGLLISGLYNIVSVPGHSTRYHVWLGVKLLLALHVFASAILAMRRGHPRRPRLLASAAFSGLAIILISAYLRRIF